MVVSAMRHTHPQAITLVLSRYPEIDEALSAIRMQGGTKSQGCRVGGPEQRNSNGVWQFCRPLLRPTTG
jgi:hypothetical protein